LWASRIVEALVATANEDGTSNLSRARQRTGASRTTLRRVWHLGIGAEGERGPVPPVSDIASGKAMWPPEVPPPPPAPETAEPPSVPTPEPVLLPEVTRSEDIERDVDRAVATVRGDAAKALTRENVLIKAGRENSIGALVLSTRMLAALEPGSHVVGDGLREMAAKRQISPITFLKLLERLTKINDRILGQAREAVELQRLVVGSPTEITEVRHRTDERADVGSREGLIAQLEELQRRRQLPEALPPATAEYAGEHGAEN
jgi:hypothetical protein